MIRRHYEIKNLEKTAKNIELKIPLSADDLRKFKELLNSCIDNNKDALRMFQDIFGRDIYDFPIKVNKCNEEVAADFYCYCFDKGRIFKKFLTYEGECSLKTYQYMVLKHLFIEWLRINRLVDSAEISVAVLDDDNEDKALYHNEDDPVSFDSLISTRKYSSTFKMLLDKVQGNKRIYLMLLLFSEIELRLNDIKEISRVSKKSVKELRHRLDILAQEIRKRSRKYNKNIGCLLNIYSKIHSLETEIERLKGATLVHKENEIKILERKLLKTKARRETFRQKRNKPIVTYRDIANILGVSLGTVSSNIKKTRKELGKALQESLNKRC